MINRTVLSLLVLLPLSSLPGEEIENPANREAIPRAVSSSLVRVEFTLRYDKGEAPRSPGWSYQCPNCGQQHSYFDAEDLIKEERPLEVAGFVLSPTRVLTRDPMLHPRFVEKIVVRFGNREVEAKPAAYARDEVAVLLELGQPLEGITPLSFDPAKAPPYFTVRYSRFDSLWTTIVGSWPEKVYTTSAGQQSHGVPRGCLIVDGDGVPVGVSMNGKIAADDSWKGSPLDWPMVTASEMSKLLAELKQRVDGSVLRVTLSFRSPKRDSSVSGISLGGESEDEGTKHDVTGILFDEKHILVLAVLDPATTALLENIAVFASDGKPVGAKFVHSLRDYGCLIAELDKPLGTPVPLAEGSILDYCNKLLPAAEVIIQGEKRVMYFNHSRLGSFSLRWKQQIFPRMGDEQQHLFPHDMDGRLLAIPMVRREKVSAQDSWSWGHDKPILVPAALVKAILTDIESYSDPSNIPLPEEEENRLAWLGVELQGLNKELARVNNVSHLTRDGETGALISYVYPDSPAAEAGVELGWILLRLHVEGEPKPFEVPAEGDHQQWHWSFPWNELDDISEEYYDQMPLPWPSAESNLNRALTDMGFGKKYTAEFFHEGRVVKRQFEITQSPPHYEGAPRYKSKPLGLTVCDLTYEARRYLQKSEDDPGVIISKIEPGSKAAVGGLKPFEVITHVNDVPVRSAKDFESLISGQAELRLGVKRLTRGRIVKLKQDVSGKEADARTETAPAEAEPQP